MLIPSHHAVVNNESPQAESVEFGYAT